MIRQRGAGHAFQGDIVEVATGLRGNHFGPRWAGGRRHQENEIDVCLLQQCAQLTRLGRWHIDHQDTVNPRLCGRLHKSLLILGINGGTGSVMSDTAGFIVNFPDPLPAPIGKIHILPMKRGEELVETP